jgi:uncharacterized lipoprotein YbaY
MTIALTTLALLTTVAVAQDTMTVTGTATYRERMALPSNAIFEATLEDASRAGAPTAVIGHTRLENPGQPPFRFSISYDPSKIEQTHSYSVRARITSGGKLMFITDQSHPVLTRGNGNQVPMMIMKRAGSSLSGGPHVVKRGMFRYMADAARFTECESRQQWPVAMEGAYKALEEAYLKNRRQPGDELLVEIEGRVAIRPNMEEGRPPIPTLVVDQYNGVFPGETCGARLASSPLQETYWKLTSIGNTPVILAEKQREPSLVLDHRKAA